MLIHLILAGLWLTAGAALIIWHVLHPEENTLRILGTNLSAGWLGVLLCLYNLVRWWSYRSRPIEPRRPLPPRREVIHEEFRLDEEDHRE